MLLKVFVAGGAGYIGSHTCVELLASGYEVIVYDNFSNSSTEALVRIERIAGKTVTAVEGDIRDTAAVSHAMSGCDAVIHFAGLKAVGDSVADSLAYYDNNVYGTLSLLKAMNACGIKQFVFSSSATVYGDPDFLPITEDHPLHAFNPYGRTKLMVEEILRDLFHSDPAWNISILRYFNPVGAHESGYLGENPQGVPNNLMPYIAQVAIGRRDTLHVFGHDYPTHDGTGVRDYIHVIDLARGHVRALEAMDKPHCTAINLGTGRGYSVLDVIRVFSSVCGKDIPYVCDARRPGDVASYYCDPMLAQTLFEWRATRDLEAMCRDMWRFQLANPQGY